MDDIECLYCRTIFEAKHPTPGDSIECPHCGAEGYGIYDNSDYMNYAIEWCPPEPKLPEPERDQFVK